MDKSFLTKNDVLFYIIYTCDADTSLHGVQRDAKACFQGVKIPKGYKKCQTELYGPKNPYNDYPEEMGMYHVKNTAVVDLDGLNKFLSNSGLQYNSETMGSLTLEFGHIPAKSFSCSEYYYGNKYENAYISAVIPNERIYETILAQLGCELEDLPMQHRHNVEERLLCIGDVLDKIMDGVVDAQDKYEPYEIPDDFNNALAVDYCQLALPL